MFIEKLYQLLILYFLQDKFVMTKMYQSEIVLESLKIGFSGLDSVHIPRLYECPHPDFPQERELPAEIVALAATTVCNCAILAQLY